MERRNFLGAGLMAGLALTFTRTTSAADASGDGPGPDVTREPGFPAWPVFEWEQRGAFQAPPLAVYGDDTAYADAAMSLKIPPVWVGTLRDHALAVLGAPADLVRGSPPGDGPYDQVRVRTDAGDFLTARLDAWQDGDPQHAYPPQIRELYQHAMGIRRHVLHAGRPWTPVGVLLAVVALDHRPTAFRPWPRALPTPADQPYQEIRLPDGPYGLPRAAGDPWPCYRLPAGRFVTATWRPLLPHEIT